MFKRLRSVRSVHGAQFDSSFSSTSLKSSISSKLPHRFKYSCPPSTATAAAAAKLKVMDGKTFDDIAAFPASNFNFFHD
ncbi:hypothetical protein [Holdemania sp. 1001302B_160321_E10]|uniref:hypothetical protein n=1 Tax=Holdemania sp. 1001302B_160321_E10 TaxID=2787120 RepID=UPI00189B7D40|nr:hypothetical protein [Holdemania sp. 1001302B_160321_E10]